MKNFNFFCRQERLVSAIFSVCVWFTSSRAFSSSKQVGLMNGNLSLQYSMRCGIISAMCKRSLTSQNFSFVGMSFNEDDGNLYHEQCYRNLNAYKCNQCKNQIDGNDIDFMLFQGDYYHNRCFACEQCHQSIAGSKFKISMGKKYCTRCR